MTNQANEGINIFGGMQSGRAQQLALGDREAGCRDRQRHIPALPGNADGGDADRKASLATADDREQDVANSPVVKDKKLKK